MIVLPTRFQRFNVNGAAVTIVSDDDAVFVVVIDCVEIVLVSDI
jgi:hypothetical protein